MAIVAAMLFGAPFPRLKSRVIRTMTVRVSGAALFIAAVGCRGRDTPSVDRNGSSSPAPKGTIDGRSISVVTKGEIEEALRKLGHAFAESAPDRRSATIEAFNVSVSDYGATSYVAIVRPLISPDASAVDGPMSAFQQAGYYAKLGCPTYLESDVLVAVCVEGKLAEARALLDKLVRH
jgi:hypothetical protein